MCHMDTCATTKLGKLFVYRWLMTINPLLMAEYIQFDDVHDVMAFGIIVDDVASCYQALGVVHSHFKPVPGKIKDYIAVSSVVFMRYLVSFAH